MEERIGGVILNYDYYCGQDLYNDGDEVEEKILDIVKKESGYEYYHPDYRYWAVMYHLSRQRENIVEPVDLNPDDEVLEIGSGMGAITGALARRCKNVDCIELSKRRSLVNAYRHREFDNINIIVGNKNLNKIHKANQITSKSKHTFKNFVRGILSKIYKISGLKKFYYAKSC